MTSTLDGQLKLTFNKLSSMPEQALTQTRVAITKYNRNEPANALRVERQAPVPTVERGHVLVKLLWRPITHWDLLW